MKQATNQTTKATKVDRFFFVNFVSLWLMNFFDVNIFKEQ